MLNDKRAAFKFGKRENSEISTNEDLENELDSGDKKRSMFKFGKRKTDLYNEYEKKGAFKFGKRSSLDEQNIKEQNGNTISPKGIIKFGMKDPNDHAETFETNLDKRASFKFGKRYSMGLEDFKGDDLDKKASFKFGKRYFHEPEETDLDKRVFGGSEDVNNYYGMFDRIRDMYKEKRAQFLFGKRDLSQPKVMLFGKKDKSSLGFYGKDYKPTRKFFFGKRDTTPLQMNSEQSPSDQLTGKGPSKRQQFLFGKRDNENTIIDTHWN